MKVRGFILHNIQKKEALKLFNGGELDELYLLIKPYLLKGDADALYFYSCFSLEDWNESNMEFDARRIKLLKQAAQKKSPEALYNLAMAYRIGENVEKDMIKSISFLKKSVELGCSSAKLTYGLDLCYGINGILDKNSDLGIRYIKEAKEDEVEGAAEALNRM